jgi:hypothetical protein
MKWHDRVKTQVYRILNRPGLRFLLSSLATIQASLKVGKYCRITYDGAWIQKFPNGTLRLRVLPEIERTMRDMFMYQLESAKNKLNTSQPHVPCGRKYRGTGSDAGRIDHADAWDRGDVGFGAWRFPLWPSYSGCTQLLRTTASRA